MNKTQREYLLNLLMSIKDTNATIDSRHCAMDDLISYETNGENFSSRDMCSHCIFGDTGVMHKTENELFSICFTNLYNGIK